ncbi:hypothetical protein JAAARDRAFT_137977 [Jaapia argillacea MUCL 33604]|uniref:Leucine carboxyl methyltransferase 1 n=1 Tax=Jaapia argillacea MUCL 33604 TaxID=933084 RepID=A0A067PD33_9AGAM|nr:hypothetical protein JAAARDRAFT_137977 [Jaapia argillacea MUCL 33604]
MLPPSLPRTGGPRDADVSIRQTDVDAAGARLSAVQRNYIRDPFIRFLVPRAHLQSPRPPLINIGTYVRSAAIDELVTQWLTLSEKEGTKCQIVSLGAGSDTRFWRIETGPHRESLSAYFELDFPEVTTKKAMAIRKSKELSAVLGDRDAVHLEHGGMALHAPRYHLLPVDLRLPPTQALAPLFSGSSSPPILSPTLPTLLLSECVFVYMSPTSSQALLRWFVDYFSSRSEAGASVLGGVVYEMFGLGDPFGKVMLQNLKSRGVSLPGADPYPNKESLPNRFRQYSFTTSQALTLREIRTAFIPSTEQERISRLELLDEIEELELVLEHYAITWGLKVPTETSLSADWNSWGLKEQTDERPGGEDGE